MIKVTGYYQREGKLDEDTIAYFNHSRFSIAYATDLFHMGYEEVRTVDKNGYESVVYSKYFPRGFGE